MHFYYLSLFILVCVLFLCKKVPYAKREVGKQFLCGEPAAESLTIIMTIVYKSKWNKIVKYREKTV